MTTEMPPRTRNSGASSPVAGDREAGDHEAGEPPVVLQTIATLAEEKLGYRGPFELQTRLVEDLELDSIRLLTLAMEVEDHFHICLDEEDEESIDTVGDLVAIVTRKLARLEEDGAVARPSPPGAWASEPGEVGETEAPEARTEEEVPAMTVGKASRKAVE